MSDAQVEIPSFADFDEPDLDSVDREPEQSTKKSKTESEESDQPAAAPNGMDFFERMAQVDAEREQARYYQAAEGQRREMNRQRWAEIHTPPPLPTGEDAEKLVIDPDAVIDLVRKNQEWTRNLVGAYGSAMSQLREETSQTIAQSQTNTTYATIAAGRVSNMVASRLADEGFENVDQAMEEADQALASDPNRYLSYRTSPEHFEQAVRYVLGQREGRAERAPRARVASGPALPYTPGAPTSSSAASAGISRDDIARAQRLLGHKFSSNALRKAGRLS